MSPQAVNAGGADVQTAAPATCKTGASSLELYRGGPSWTDAAGNEVAKGVWYWSSARYTPEEHMACNPWDSQWISLTSDWAVACYFACSKKDLSVAHSETSKAVFSVLGFHDAGGMGSSQEDARAMRNSCVRQSVKSENTRTSNKKMKGRRAGTKRQDT